ncbi:hypothetical protein IWQ62_002303 [Dispira parvispora]|uniref:Palmitoyl-protein thioesterase 1 n=1 Tax=Dispira parvispora TaxID=1520584 RepID=A0A9W8AT18_9FUNG|nr:hypothetical protein IWQ62_002303 [Dispira parvispora]
MRFVVFITLYTVISLTLVCPSIYGSSTVQPRPLKAVVVWQGLGQAYLEETFLRRYLYAHSFTYVHFVKLAEENESNVYQSYVGNMESQLYRVCGDLKKNGQLKEGFDAIGLSQGGLFMRAYVEFCNDPPVKSLITLGTPHTGISNIPPHSNTFMHELQTLFYEASALPFIKNRLVPCQYTAQDLDSTKTRYSGDFLTLINNGGHQALNTSIRSNMVSLTQFTMISFLEEQIIIPKESTRFDYICNGNVVSLRNTDYFKEDRLGLKTLDENGRLHFKECRGGHLNLDRECLKILVDSPVADL